MLLNYPRVSFFLLHVGCTFASGFLASYTLTDLFLDRARVPDAVHNVQQDLQSARLQLQNRSACVVEATLRNLMAMKSAVQAHQSEIQDLVHINAKTLDAFEDDSAACKFFDMFDSILVLTLILMINC
jgi:hypothetical protein